MSNKKGEKKEKSHKDDNKKSKDDRQEKPEKIEKSRKIKETDDNESNEDRIERLERQIIKLTKKLEDERNMHNATTRRLAEAQGQLLKAGSRGKKFSDRPRKVKCKFEPKCTDMSKDHRRRFSHDTMCDYGKECPDRESCPNRHECSFGSHCKGCKYEHNDVEEEENDSNQEAEN